MPKATNVLETGPSSPASGLVEPHEQPKWPAEAQVNRSDVDEAARPCCVERRVRAPRCAGGARHRVRLAVRSWDGCEGRGRGWRGGRRACVEPVDAADATCPTCVAGPRARGSRRARPTPGCRRANAAMHGVGPETRTAACHAWAAEHGGAVGSSLNAPGAGTFGAKCARRVEEAPQYCAQLHT